MALLGMLEILLAVFCFAAVRWFSNRNETMRSWPLMGALPDLLLNVRRHSLLDWLLYHAERCGGTYLIRGPWFTNMDLMGTLDPENLRYILSTNFSNYPKGSEFQKIFDIFGDGLFSSDFESWKVQRKIAVALVSDRKFCKFLEQTTKEKVLKGLIPVLDHVSEQGMVVDMQALTHRFATDMNFTLFTGYDPGTLSIEFPEHEFSKAMDDMEKVMFYRHVTPEIFWKLQRKLRIGVEPLLEKAWEIMDQKIEEIISRKRRDIRKGEEGSPDLLTSYMRMELGEELLRSKSEDKFMRDTVFHFLITRENSLAWFFWLIATNPEAEAKILEELKSIVPANEPHDQFRVFDSKEVNNLVYLRAALYEMLRLYTTVPFMHKNPVKPDILPSGHHFHPRMRIMSSSYVMGRMKSIWGEDAREFKPERWISEEGGIKPIPSNKFISFNTGPRICLGKQIALTQMKAVAAVVLTITMYKLWKDNYLRQPKNGAHLFIKKKVAPTTASTILHMKHGCKVRITKRWAS